MSQNIEQRERPETFLRVAIGTAGVCGLANLSQKTAPTTAHLLVGDRCRRGCAYCTQARGAGARVDRLSRLSWPAFPEREVIAGLEASSQRFQRICIQTLDSRGVIERACGLLFLLSAGSRLPISVSLTPGSSEDIDVLFDAGADRISLPLDAATPEIHSRVGRGRFEETIDLLEKASERYRGRIFTHLIVGLGETEAEMAALLMRLKEAEVGTALFAFTPCHGTAMAAVRPPDRGAYRRIQAARHLIERGLLPDIRTDREGRLSIFDDPEIVALVGSEAFETSGCPGCNRPCYNEPPGAVPYNHPRPLSREEFEAALKLLKVE